MRSYIFTTREKRILRSWLEGKDVDAIDLSKLLYRVKTFRALEGDVDLWLQVNRRLKAKPPPAGPT